MENYILVPYILQRQLLRLGDSVAAWFISDHTSIISIDQL